jgi:hypothetical protein
LIGVLGHPTGNIFPVSSFIFQLSLPSAGRSIIKSILSVASGGIDLQWRAEERKAHCHCSTVTFHHLPCNLVLGFSLTNWKVAAGSTQQQHPGGLSDFLCRQMPLSRGIMDDMSDYSIGIA